MANKAPSPRVGLRRSRAALCAALQFQCMYLGVAENFLYSLITCSQRNKLLL